MNKDVTNKSRILNPGYNSGEFEFWISRTREDNFANPDEVEREVPGKWESRNTNWINL